jgi:phage terminase large subunit-like protein
MILFDDPQGKEEVFSQRNRDKDKEQFDTEIAFLGGPMASLDLIMIGTIVHYDCLIEYASTRQGWKTLAVDAIQDEEKRVTYWPEVYAYHTDDLTPWEIENWERRGTKGYFIRDCMFGTVFKDNEPYIISKHDQNPSAFNQEFRHLPMKLESMPLRSALWKYFDLSEEFVFGNEQNKTQGMKYRIATLDLSKGKKKSDWQALACVGWLNNNYYLLDGSLTKVDLVSEDNNNTLIGVIIEKLKMYKIQLLAIEDNGGLFLFVPRMLEAVKNAGLSCRVVGFTSKTNKIDRITNELGVVIQQGLFHVRRDYKKVYPEFMKQFDTLPMGANDDAPDVTNMAVQGIQNMRG